MARVTSPEEFFGYKLGSDRKIARWDRIVEYFQKLGTESDRIEVVEMGKTTDGNPFILAVISSPENLGNLEHLRQINLKIADPRGLDETQVKELMKEGRAVICQSMSLHASEIGGTQMAPELAYDLLSCDCPDTLRILENVIFLMVPSFNPDGNILVTNWYNKWVGTEYEGSMLPVLYHKYTGHDNNRDAFAQNIPESQYMGKILFTEWKPQAYQDHHHMGAYGPRLFVSPYSDPIRPNADPLVWRELSWYGAHMAYMLEQEGKTGIVNAAQFGGWGHLGFHWITPFHNIAGMLTESASAKLATPMYVHPHQLEGASKKTMPKYEAQTNFPHPWPGGWWHLRDIVEQQKIASWAVLDIAARYRETVLWNAYIKAKRQTEAGASGTPSAYVISPEQHDPLTMTKLVDILLKQGVEVKIARKQFNIGNKTYPVGTYVIFMAQPKMGLIKTLLGRTFYPDSYWTRNPDGSPVMYDMASDTAGEYMGVCVEPVDCCFEGEFSVVDCACPAPCAVTEARAGYVIDGRVNDAFKVVNALLRKGAKVWRLDEPVAVGCGTLPQGAFFVDAFPGIEGEARSLSVETGVSFCSVQASPEVKKRPVKNLRVGMYQRYWGGNMDEGWTRFLFDKWGFAYCTMMDADIREGNLKDRIDVLILPSDRKELMVDVTKIDPKQPEYQMLVRYIGMDFPPEYKSGFGEEGKKKIKEFVEAGGRLVALDHASDFAIDALGLKVRNVVGSLDFRSFWCHGSTLHAKVDNTNPLAYGMPDEALVFYLDSPTFEIMEAFNADRYQIIAEYPTRDLLQSGWLIGEEKIAGFASMVTVKAGKGEVVLFGFRPQHRAQTHGTFKLLFNCLY